MTKEVKKEIKGGEFVGYRPNTREVTVPCNAKGVPLSLLDGFVTVYAERRNVQAVLGEYGGDAYPVCYEESLDGRRFGMVLAADGVGQGSYTHPSLEKYLREHTQIAEGKTEADPADMLAQLLLDLYGMDMRDDKNKDVLDYAARSFAPVPKDGFFVAQEEVWKDRDNGQFVMPFYKRDSQSLGSRITCVGLYKEFRRYAADVQSWTKDSVDILREKVERYLAQLGAKINKIFSYDDAPDTTKRERYFLCSTVAMWIYFYTEGSDTVQAVALNMGDARCYALDTVDGVRQVSEDDAFANGDMSAFVHYGSKPKTTDGYTDGEFRARVVELRTPCALMACSDGVYDTCPGMVKEGEDKAKPPYALTDEACDFCFEYNLLDILRRSYSLEDFRREVVFNLFAQSTTKGAGTSGPGYRYVHVKRDDSGTLAARFFGKTPLELAVKLRQNKDTSLDKLYETLAASAREGTKIPFVPPVVQSSDDQNTELRKDYAMGAFKNAIEKALRDAYGEAFESMKEAGAQTLWGVPHESETILSGFKLTKFLTFNTSLVTFLCVAADDWVETEGKEHWLKHEHLLCFEGVRTALEEIGFGEKIPELMNKRKDEHSELLLRQYDWFADAFFGKEVRKASRRDVISVTPRIWSPFVEKELQGSDAAPPPQEPQSSEGDTQAPPQEPQSSDGDTQAPPQEPQSSDGDTQAPPQGNNEGDAAPTDIKPQGDE